MKLRTIVFTLALALTSLTLCFAENPNLGTWKLNEAKSKFGPAAAKNNTVVFEAAGDEIKITTEGVDGQGNPMHRQWKGKFDGKDYPLSGDPNSGTRAYKVINDRIMEGIDKRDGKVTTTARIVLSADGKTRTVTVKGTNAAGKPVHSKAVYEKQ
jgi:hypothetical protein